MHSVVWLLALTWSIGSVADCPNPISEWVSQVLPATSSSLGVASAEDGGAYATGYEGQDEPPFTGSNVVLTHFDSHGVQDWRLAFGGQSSGNQGVAVRTLLDGSVAVLGNFEGTVDFDPGIGQDNWTTLGTYNVFVAKFSAEGGYRGVNVIGRGQGLAYAGSFTSDPLGNLVMVGMFYGSLDFDPSPTADIQSAAADSYDAYVTKLNADGSYAWTRTFGGPGNDEAASVAVDSLGNILVAGGFRGTVDFDPGPGTDLHSASGFNDIFVSKFTTAGSHLWTRTFPPDVNLDWPSITVDANGDPVFSSYFSGTVDFDPTAGMDFHTATTDADLFVTKLDADGNYLWTRTFEGEARAIPNDITVDPAGNIILAGAYSGTVDFDPGPGVEEHHSNGKFGGVDAFVVMLSVDGEFRWVRTIAGPNSDNEIIHDLALDNDGDLIILGQADAQQPVDLDPGCATDFFVAPSEEGLGINFVLKLTCANSTPDTNGDGVVDLRDFASLQNCFTEEARTVCLSGCEILDFDHDDDIDLIDFASFQE